MGKKRNISIDLSQEEEFYQRSDNKYSSAFDLPEEFAMMAELDKPTADTEPSEEDQKAKKKTTTRRTKKVTSKRYKNLKKIIDSQKEYPLKEAVSTVLDVSREKFDATIELNLQVKKDNISGSVNLPHGTGKEKKVVIFSNEILKQIADKQIDFDVLIARPQDMPKLAKHAKLLGPKGLMPNPKNGTISQDPEKAAKDLGGNKIVYKTEKKAPLIHLIVGKKSFGEQKLTENIQAVLDTISSRQIKKASISSTMSPGIRIKIDSATQ
ncbi:MAG: hypothetical protein ACOX6V_04360 [Patescibacteria group bacterium]|jgi:large subunit ribosomal protein L1